MKKGEIVSQQNIQKNASKNFQKPSHLAQKCSRWPAPIAGSDARPNTVRNGNIYNCGLKMQATASICITPRYVAFVPTLQLECISIA